MKADGIVILDALILGVTLIGHKSLVDCALAVYIQNGLSIKNPVQCLDLSITKKESSKWIGAHGPAVNVMESQINVNGIGDKKVHCSESNYTIIEQTDFNFIYVECTTEGSSYFDCVFRKIARNGLFALTTSDDPALYGRPPEPALRCYSGRIARTFYSSEMAIRLILASMARSAARFSKSIEVLLAITIKNSITLLVKVKKGADATVTCLKEVKTLVHCTVCEERAFLPENDGYVVDNAHKFLSCECAAQNVGRTILALGPLWAGPIGSMSFTTDMLQHAKHSAQLVSFLQNIIVELRCDRKVTKENQSKQLECENSSSLETKTEEASLKTCENNSSKRKADSESCDVMNKQPKCEEILLEPAPAFYYNLHKHKPKGSQTLLKADKVVEILQQQGFRASRTHFDRGAVKTDATLSRLQTVLSQCT